MFNFLLFCCIIINQNNLFHKHPFHFSSHQQSMKNYSWVTFNLSLYTKKQSNTCLPWGLLLNSIENTIISNFVKIHINLNLWVFCQTRRLFVHNHRLESIFSQIYCRPWCICALELTINSELFIKCGQKFLKVRIKYQLSSSGQVIATFLQWVFAAYISLIYTNSDTTQKSSFSGYNYR